MQFSLEKQISAFEPDVNSTLEFLASSYNTGLGYNSLNIARSALSPFIYLPGDLTVGVHSLVKRFMKGAFHRRRSLSRYKFTWGVSHVLSYLKTMHIQSVSLKLLSGKLLMSLVLGDQTLHLIDIRNIEVTDDQLVIRIENLFKFARPGNRLSEMVLKANMLIKICVLLSLYQLIYNELNTCETM